MHGGRTGTRSPLDDLSGLARIVELWPHLDAEARETLAGLVEELAKPSTAITVGTVDSPNRCMPSVTAAEPAGANTNTITPTAAVPAPAVKDGEPSAIQEEEPRGA